MLNRLKNIFLKTNAKENLFIHIPKCGGSTFVGLLKQSSKLSSKEKSIPSHKISKVGNTEIAHVDFSNKYRQFKKPVLFNSKLHENFKGKNIFLLVRNPVDRLFSEFNFQYHILDGKNGNPKAAIIQKLKKKPKSFEEYINCLETQNYQCKFLIGRSIADSNPLREDEFERIIQAIENLNINCGVTEEYQKFLSVFQSVSKTKLVKTTTQRKKTPNKFKGSISETLNTKIKKLNHFDERLYNYVLEKVKQQTKSNNSSITINNTEEFII